MTQEELASRLKVSRQTINAVENGKYNPSLGLAIKMSKMFGVRIKELFKD
jgi:putative transcriptional regulator